LQSPVAIAGVRFVAARRHRRKLEIERKSVPFRFCDAPGVATGKKGAPGRRKHQNRQGEVSHAGANGNTTYGALLAFRSHRDHSYRASAATRCLAHGAISSHITTRARDCRCGRGCRMVPPEPPWAPRPGTLSKGASPSDFRRGAARNIRRMGLAQATFRKHAASCIPMACMRAATSSANHLCRVDEY
jgi:hypothetical protein